MADDQFADGNIDILAILVASGLAASRSEARRAVEQGGVTVKGEKVTDVKKVYSKEEIAALSPTTARISLSSQNFHFPNFFTSNISFDAL